VGRGRGERFRHSARIAIIRQALSEFGVPLSFGIRNCSISYQTVKPKSKPLLLPFSPKFGEKDSPGPGEGPR
jgi:hypothetical protein